MHPAKSVIFFTTASGAGYGLLFWFAILGLFDLLPSGPVFVIVGFGVALGLITAGLISSTFHLGHPERAWRAFSQWRTSWLSREGVAAVATYVPAAAWGISALIEGFGSPLSQTLGVVAAIGAAVTVYCTGMIYASLRTIPAWHNDWARAGYPIFAAMTGACLAVLLLSLFETGDITKFVFVSIVLFLVGGFAKRGYFEAIDEAKPTSTAETATGLGDWGKVRLLEKPHSGTNYLMREMGFEIARKHAAKLRRLCLICGFAVPALLLLLSLALPAARPSLAFVAVFFAGVGIAVERWLFFAEAKHAVTLYYGEEAV